MIRRLSVIIGFLCMAHGALAQYSYQEEWDFATYLIQNNRYEQAIQELKNIRSRYPEQTRTLDDSIAYLIGKQYYWQKSLDEAIHSLNAVSPQSSLHNEASFFKGISQVYQMHPGEGFESFREVQPKDSIHRSLKALEMAGTSLLLRDYDQYTALSAGILKKQYFFQNSYESLEDIYADLSQHKDKSPLLAGVLSAIVPGSGKFYAGKRGEGIYAFIISSFLGLQTWEGYRKDGLNSPRCIIYGSLFTLFYAGNIWGSAIAASQYNREYYDAIDYKIRLDMHIPIRRIFQ